MEVRDGWTRPWRYDSSDLPQREVSLAELTGGDAAQNAAMLRALLDGEPGARREAVLLNAGLGLVVEGSARDLREGYERAREAVDAGAAGAVFERLREASARARTPETEARRP
jgi:anthranilate phosphoribosyltransferase